MSEPLFVLLVLEALCLGLPAVAALPRGQGCLLVAGWRGKKASEVQQVSA